jgi:hypothetical protein
MSLFEYLEQNLKRTEPYPVTDHVLRAEQHEDGRISFYIHPQGVDGATPDFWVEGNTLRKKTFEEPRS